MYVLFSNTVLWCQYHFIFFKDEDQEDSEESAAAAAPVVAVAALDTAGQRVGCKKCICP